MMSLQTRYGPSNRAPRYHLLITMESSRPQNETATAEAALTHCLPATGLNHNI